MTWVARLAAIDPLLLAQECLNELDLDQSQPIDVLDALARLELITTMVDLGDVLGVVLPQGGVMLTSERGEAVQRYTAAHEIGHWVMHQDTLLVDRQREITGEPLDRRERQAQLFASYFLMPPPLLMDALRLHQVRPHRVTPGQAYLLARDLRVSYVAALVRLETEQYLTQQAARTLRNLGRAKARSEAFAGRRPERGYAELWSAGITDATHLKVTVDDEIVVQLPENRTTPYRWQPLSDSVHQPPSRATRRPAPPPIVAASPESGGLNPKSEPDKPTLAARRAALALVPERRDLRRQAGAPGVPLADGAFVVIEDAFHLNEGVDVDLKTRRASLKSASEEHNSALAAVGTQVAPLGERLLQLQCRHEGEHALVLQYRHSFTQEAPPAATWTLFIEVAPNLTTRQRRRLLDIDLDERQVDDPDDDVQFG